MNTCWEDIFSASLKNWDERDHWETNQDHLVLKSGQNLLANHQQLHKACRHLQEKAAYLVTMVATDERYLEDGCFKLYYVFSHENKDHFLILEYPLRDLVLSERLLPENPLSGYLLSGRCYPTIRHIFAAAASFEREIFDLFDLVAVVVDDAETISSADPLSDFVPSSFLLHNPYPPHLAPMEVSKRVDDIKKKIEEYTTPFINPGKGKVEEVLFPVGPIHAGVIEAGRFSFHIAGEVVDEVDIQLGYKHKGIEKLFQAKFSILDGWQLAERVSGDSSFSHSMAYCHAVEALARIEIPSKATLLRGLYLELERLYNHVGDSAALARDVAFDLVASEIAVIREYLVRLNAELSGHRFLRGTNRPGGVVLPLRQVKVLNRAYIDALTHKVSRNRFGSLEELIEEFRELGELLIRTPAFRERAINTGNLKTDQALKHGATGLVARASGIGQRDFRVNHPSGIYQLEPDLQMKVGLRTQLQKNEEPKRPRMSGDVFSRLDMRLHEVNTSFQVIQHILGTLEISPSDTLIEPFIDEAIRRAENFEFALGYVEGWRGDIVYWVMKDRFNRIFRCKVRDPSFLNWPALRVAVIPDDPDQPDATGNILPDFPVINKSFNLSYSGHDL